MISCHANKKTVITKSFFGKETSEIISDEDHEWDKWSAPIFRGSKWEQVGKKTVELGNSYQRRTCRLCGLVDEVQL